ncbi:MAG: hypothetical protein IPN44_04415 [Flavobacteriales bacterium]|nr:hypothetical protein [Flavobacteriales bacterium]
MINGVINGGIQFFFLKDKALIAVSVDSITNNDDTVLGAAVGLAIMLAMIGTIVTYFGIKEKKVSFYPTAFWTVIRHGFFTFGVVASLSVLWQRYVGTVEVSLWTALITIALIAGAVAGVINYLTIEKCTLNESEVK